MKKTLLNFTVITCLASIAVSTYGGVPAGTKWIAKDPFQQKVFIENKGQYHLQNNVPTSDILFGAQLDGLSYYFTKNGIYVEHYKAVKRTAEELAKLQLPVDKVDAAEKLKGFQYKFVPELHYMNFVGSNTTDELVTSGDMKQYYNFKTTSGNIKANAFKKLIYKNLYPGIDMEFYFPDNKQGFEYNFIVHPGADVSQIKIQYPLSNSVELKSGNIIVESLFGNFTDHAPVASQSANHINCSFNLQNGIVQFTIGNYNKNQDLIIDPWTATPVFPGSVSDRAYDVDWDNAGNVYAYGGSGQYAVYPLYMLKYDSTGTLLWETQIDDYYSQDYGTELYGDFVVNKATQSIFVAQGVNIVSGAKIIKMDQSGAQVDSFGGNTSMDAIFRIVYSTTYNELVGVGGSYPNYPAPTAMYVDTNFISSSVVYVNNPPNPYDYMWGVALDNSGNAYMAISGHNTTDTSGNDLFKVPMPTLSPTTWEVNDGYTIAGIIDPQYLAHNNGNGFNGIAVGDTNLYTYDSYTLKRWSTTNGSLIKALPVNVNTAQYIYWSGLVADSCGKVFLGSHDTVKVYDYDLNLITYFLAPDSIYDLSLSKNTLYACGAGFIASYPLTPTLITAKPGTTIKVCLGNSTTLTALGASSYAWSPSTGLNNTTANAVVASPLATTTYTVICTGNLNCNAISIDTFKIIVKVDSSLLPTVTVSPTSDTLCLGQSVSLKGSGALTYQWNPANGLSADTGSAVTAKPVVATTYTIVGTDSKGCYNTAQTVITIDTVPQVFVFPNFGIICQGQSDTLFGYGQSNYQWSPSTSLSSSTGDSVIATPTISTIYTASVVGGDGCVGTATAEVYVYAKPNVIITPPSPGVCSAQSITLIATGGKTYQWYPYTGLSDSTGDTIVANPAITTTYTVIGKGIGGCLDTTQFVFTIDTAHINFSPLSPSICVGQSVLLFASGSANYQWSPSTGLNVTTGDSVVATPLISTTYTVNGTDSFGCSAVGYDTVTAFTPPNKPTITIKGDTLTSSASTNNQWYFNGNAINGATNQIYIANDDTGWYTVSIVNPANGCSSASDSVHFTTTGINQLSPLSSQLSVYPNPFNKIIYVTINPGVSDLKNWNLQITDVLGRTVYQTFSVNYTNSINFSEIPSGVYFITVFDLDKKVVVPIIRQE